MQTIDTLSQLVSESECDYMVFDLGRRIQLIDNQQFASVEQGQQPYPYPLQRHAKFAIVYWNESKQPWFWFLNFELDERGLLMPANVGQFIRYVLEAMGTRLTNNLSEEQQNKLANNPFTFKPNEEKMAVLHSLVRAKLSHPASQYYEHAQHYFKGELGWDKWQSVGLQGITDMAARLSDEQNHRHFIRSLKHLPSQPLYGLLGALEHVSLTSDLSNKLAEFTLDEMQGDEPDLFLLSALIRALSGGDNQHLTDVVQQLLSQAQLCHPEILVALAGRSWQALAETAKAELFLVRLAQTQDQNLFNQLFADLVMIPQLRMIMLPLLHSTPSPQLVDALTNLQKSTLGQTQ
ncbi:DUF3549 family protein [Vibrio sp. RC27]